MQTIAIKIFWMCVGHQPGKPPHKNFGLEIVQTLVNSIHNSGLNPTIDNFFTSVPLENVRLDKRITILRQNKRDIAK